MAVIFTENFNSFAGAGFAPTPGAGQLDSDIFRAGIFGDAPATLLYGGTATTGDFARGLAAGAVTTGGIYASTANGADRALLVQPSTGDFDPGFIELRVLNTTGAALTDFTVDFEWIVRNDQTRTQTLTFQYSTDGTNFISVPAASITSDSGAAGVLSTLPDQAVIAGLNIIDGGFIFFRWAAGASTGSGSRDEVGIDDIVVNATGGASVTPVVTIAATDGSATEGSDPSISFTLTRTGDTSQALSVVYTVAAAATNGATPGEDFTPGALTGTAVFAAGSGTAVIGFTAVDDTLIEVTETFTVSLVDGAAYDLGAQTSASAAIADNDTPPPATPVIEVTASDASATEGSDPGFAFTFTRNGGDLAQQLTVSFAFGGTATAADFTAPGGAPAPTTVTFAAGAATAVLNLVAVDDTLAEPAEQVVLTLTDTADYDLGAAATATATITSDDVAVTRISTIQGSGASSALVGQTVTVEAVIVGDFQNGDADTRRDLGGFFIQEERADSDGDAATSEGLFVFQGAGAIAAGGDFAVGQRVRVTGVVSEQFGLTQLQNPTVTLLAGDGSADVSAAILTIPGSNLEAFEGMLVTVPDRLVITEQFELDRLGEIRLYAPEGDGFGGLVNESADGRPYTFTQTNAPSAAGFAAHNQEIARRSIIYDDGLNGTNRPIQNPDGSSVYNTATAPQMGDSITGLTGVLDFGFSNFRIRGVGPNDFVDTNPREATPDPVGGSLRVGSFNVLNFFVTLDAGGARIDNGQQPRGANTQAEFDRQVDKLVTAIVTLDADILGLIEIENDFNNNGMSNFVGGNAIGFLVDQLNLRLGGLVYDFINPGPDAVGTDAISTGFIYQRDAVRVAEGTMIAIDNNPVHNRPPIAVTFEEIATGGEFTAVVNHFKSKGSGTGVNADQNDGQGASNADRVAQAEALDQFLDRRPTGSTDPDYLILGDLNAYFREDPINVLRREGYESLGGPESYSFTFDGRIGSLDHLMPNRVLLGQATGVTQWHVNADEADALDYNLDNGRDPAIFNAAAPFRNSDHDPLLVGLALAPTQRTQTGTDAGETLTGSNGMDTLNGGGGDDILNGGRGADRLEGGAGSDQLNGGDGDDLLAGDAGERDTLNGGAGSDTVGYAGADRGVIVDFDVQLTWDGQLNDTLSSVENAVGTDFDDIFFGSSANNVIDGGRGGADDIRGYDGNDTVSYASSERGVIIDLDVQLTFDGVAQDRLQSIENARGSAFADIVFGSAEGNRIEGGAGADQLNGYGGADILVGGADADVLFGGADADRFVFTALSDSRVDASDRITDFSAAEGDLIDLSGIDANAGSVGDQAFVFVSAFSGAAGQAVLSFDGAANRTTLTLDVDGDSQADFRLLMDGNVGAASGFVL